MHGNTVHIYLLACWDVAGCGDDKTRDWPLHADHSCHPWDPVKRTSVRCIQGFHLAPCQGSPFFVMSFYILVRLWLCCSRFHFMAEFWLFTFCLWLPQSLSLCLLQFYCTVMLRPLNKTWWLLCLLLS